MEDGQLVGPVDAGKMLSEVVQIRLRDPDAEGPYLGVLSISGFSSSVCGFL